MANAVLSHAGRGLIAALLDSTRPSPRAAEAFVHDISRTSGSGCFGEDKVSVPAVCGGAQSTMQMLRPPGVGLTLLGGLGSAAS